MSARPAILIPVVLWVVPQLTALILSAAQVPLSPAFPRPSERAALELMLCIQFTTAALLFPMLLPNRLTSLAIIALAWVYLLLAGFMATAPLAGNLWAGLHLTAWLAALSAWAPLPRTRRTTALAVAAAVLLFIAPVILLYIRLEYQPGVPSAPLHHTPLLAAIRQAQSADLHAISPSLAGLFLLVGLVLHHQCRRRPRP